MILRAVGISKAGKVSNDLVGDPAKKFVLIMKDGKIFKNTVR